MKYFRAYTFSDPENELTPQKVFVCMAIFNVMRIGLTLFPHALKEFVKAYVCVQRINDFLNAEELDENCIFHLTGPNVTNAIEVSEATLSWEDSGTKPTLRNLSFKIPQGSLVAIVGSVGSGKSSLLAGILGEMAKTSGSISRYIILLQKILQIKYPHFVLFS